jgi:hypothetical protein
MPVIAPAEPLVRAAVIAAHRHDMVDRRHRSRDQDARHDTGDQQTDEIDFRIGERVDDDADRRRNDRPENRRRGRERGGVGRLVAVVAHHADHDRAGSCRIGERRAGDPREERDRQDVRVAEAPAEATDELRREPQQHVRQLAAGHQLGGEDEERHRLERKQVDAREQILGQRDQRHVARSHCEQCRPAERECNRHPERQKRDAGDEKQRHHFRASLRRRRTRRRPAVRGERRSRGT